VLDSIPDELARVDVLLTSTSAPGHILARADVARTLPERKGRPLFLIDIAVPRDLDPAIHELDGCYLYDIDDLESVVAESLAGRRRRRGLRRCAAPSVRPRRRCWFESAHAAVGSRSRRPSWRRSGCGARVWRSLWCRSPLRATATGRGRSARSALAASSSRSSRRHCSRGGSTSPSTRRRT